MELWLQFWPIYFKCVLIPGRFVTLVSKVGRFFFGCFVLFCFFLFFPLGVQGSPKSTNPSQHLTLALFLDQSYSPTPTEIYPRKFEKKKTTVLQQFWQIWAFCLRHFFLLWKFFPSSPLTRGTVCSGSTAWNCGYNSHLCISSVCWFLTVSSPSRE